MRTFISFEDARHLVLDDVEMTSAEECPLYETLGRTLAEDVVSLEDLPCFTSSAMDGFAVRSEDLGPDGGSLQVVEHVAAGHSTTRFVGRGEAVRVMTGAPVPAGADAVVPVEWTNFHGQDGTRWVDAPGSRVLIDRPVDHGKNVRPAGEDIRQDTTVLEGGTVVTPPALGMMASLGRHRVMVRRAPKVMIVTTGDEVVHPNEMPGFGQIRNSNGPGLAAQVQLAGGQTYPGTSGYGYVHIGDDRDEIRHRIDRCGDADLLVLSGGVSVGAHDHVMAALQDAGFEVAFWKVRQRPGKPLLFGRLGAARVLGLPGNPVSAAMCFEQYGRPLLARMLGRLYGSGEMWHARLGERLAKPEGLHWFVRGVATQTTTGELEVVTTGAQGSNLYGSVLRANCIVHLPVDMVDPAPGTRVHIEWMPWFSPS